VGAIRAKRYTYGKLIQGPGGAVVGGFEHQVTSQSGRLDPCILEACHPLDLVGRVATTELVHPSAHGRGALFLWPVRCEDEEHLVLARVRPRPEAGEGRPGRTYTQLNAFVFRGRDWHANAPEIVATVPHWLKAEPDLEADSNPRDAPPLELPDLPALCPDDRPLPGPDDPSWAALRGLEDSRRPALLGPEGFPDEATFYLALGQALALLPPPMRTLVTACAGFAAPRPEFAIQLLPKDLGRAQDQTLGYFAQLAQGHHCTDFAAWRRVGAKEFGDTRVSSAWRRPVEARAEAARLIEDLSQKLVLTHLNQYLQGELPRCPALPTGPKAAKVRTWIVARISEKLHQGLEASRPSLALARAAEVAAGLNGPEWKTAWITAAVRFQHNEVPLWSALRSAPGHDDPDLGVGVIQSFGDLGKIRRLTALIGDYYREAGLTNPRVLRHAGLAARVEPLLARTSLRLESNPAELALLAQTLPDAFARHPSREAVRSRLQELVPALGLLALVPKPEAQGHRVLYEAAGRVLAASYRMELPTPEAGQGLWTREAQKRRRIYLERCVDTAIAGHADGAHFWAQALGCALLAGSDLATAVETLLGLVDKHPAVTFSRGGDRLEAPLAVTFERIAAAAGPADLAVAVLESLLHQGIQLGSEPGPNRLRLAVAKALQARLFAAIGASDAAGLGRIAPLTARVLDVAASWSSENIARYEFASNLGRHVLERMVALGDTDRARAVGILEPLEIVMYKSPARAWAERANTRNTRNPNRDIVAMDAPPASAQNYDQQADAFEQNIRMQEQYRQCVEALTKSLAKLLLSWAEAPVPEPWFPRPGDRRPAECPVRWRLIGKLGFPWALYFGRLAEPGDRIKDTSTPRETTPAERRVMALCGVALWRELYATTIPLQRSKITDLLRAQGANEALDGLDEIVAEGEPRLLEAVGEDMVFLADFFRLGGPPPRRDTTPMAIRRVLLSTDLEGDAQTACLPLFLARGVLTASKVDLAIGQKFRKALGPRASIANRLLGPKVEFDRLDDEAVAARLDRVLFALALLYVKDPRGNPSSHQRAPIPASQFRAFSLGDGQAPRIGAFFKARPEYLDALERTVSLARRPELEGWPWP